MTKREFLILFCVVTLACTAEKREHASDASAASDGRDADAPAGSSCSYPRCLETLFAQCRPIGSCTREAHAGETRQCYANGVSIAASQASGASSAIFTARRAEVMCYRIDADLASRPIRLTWRAPGGDAVAYGALADGNLTAACDGDEPTLVGPHCDPTGASSDEVSDACKEGACR